MKSTHIILFLSLVFTGCKNNRAPQRTTFVSFSNHEINERRVRENPLIIYNGKPIGKLKESNLSEEKFNNEISGPSSFPANSKTMLKIFGDDAIDGILTFEDRTLLYCKKSPPTLFILNDEIVEISELKNLKWKKLKRFSQINWVKREQDTAYLYSSIWFMETK